MSHGTFPLFSGVQKVWVALLPSRSCQTAPWQWTSGYRWLVLDFEKEVIYYSSTSSGRAHCKPLAFSEIKQIPPAPACKVKGLCVAEQKCGAAVCQPDFRIPFQLGSWRTNLVVLSVADHERVCQLLCAAGQLVRPLTRSMSNCSTMASSGSLQEKCQTTAAPEVCRWKRTKGQPVARPLERGYLRVYSPADTDSTLVLEKEYQADWLCLKAARDMTAHERVQTDLNLANCKKVWMATKLGTGSKPGTQVRRDIGWPGGSSQERQRADLKLVGL